MPPPYPPAEPPYQQTPPPYPQTPPPYPPGQPSPYPTQPAPYPTEPEAPPQWEPQFAQPAPQWQPAGPGEWPPVQGPWEQLGQPPGPPPRRRRRAPLVALIAAVAVLGGGTATYLAATDSNSGYHGAASPQEAVKSLISDLNKSDLLGILDHLPPGERASLLDPMKESIDQAKRLHLLKASASGSRLDGLDLTATNVSFDQQDEAINDHVKIVKLVGGTITINADLSKVPFTDEYLKLAFPHGLPSTSRYAQTINLGNVVRDNGEPLRLAAQRLGGRWYPSLSYTIADAIVHQNGGRNPTSADFVAPRGGASPQDAVRQTVDAIARRDARRLIELASPDELAVVHDYGGLILDSTPPPSGTQFTVKNLQLATKPISDGVRVSLRSITVAVPDHEVTVTVAGDCLEITADGDYRKVCADDLFSQLNAGPLQGKPITAEEKAALTRLAQGIPNIGIDTSSSNGQWYVNPVRSYLDITNAVVEPLHDNDLLVLIRMFSR